MYLYPAVGAMPADLFPTSLLVIGTLRGWFEIPIATLVGAGPYGKEGGPIFDSSCSR